MEKSLQNALDFDFLPLLITKLHYLIDYFMVVSCIILAEVLNEWELYLIYDNHWLYNNISAR